MKDREELVKELVENHGAKEEDLKGKRAKTLQEMLNNISKVSDFTEEMFSEPQEEITENNHTKENVDYLLKMADIGWTKYVTNNLLDKSEIQDGHPNIHGLRRIARKIFGSFNTTLKAEQVPCKENGNKSAVSVTIEIPQYGIKHSDIAETTFFNCDEPYSNYPLSTAATRAEGRALKKLLGLQCFTFEEIGTSKIATNKASDMMINTIKGMANTKSLDLQKLVAQEFEDLEAVELATSGQIEHLMNIIKES